MLDNTALIEALIGTTGIASLVGTALLARTPLGAKLGELAALKDKVENRVEQRLSQLERGLAYIEGKFDSLERILSDGTVTPAEVEELQAGAREIKDEIGRIVRGNA